MRARCKALKAWAASNPDLSGVTDKRTRAGLLLLLKHITLTVKFDEAFGGHYVFEYDAVREHELTTNAERDLNASYRLIQAWQRGEDVTFLKLAQTI
jgi:hypothetical protein